MKSKSAWERPNKRESGKYRGPWSDKQLLRSIQPDAVKEARSVEAECYAPQAYNKVINQAMNRAL